MGEVGKRAAFLACLELVSRAQDELKSENLLLLYNAMEPDTIGGGSGDPAMDDVWDQLWGQVPLRSESSAALVAAQFLRAEGDWGESDKGQIVLADSLEAGAKGVLSDLWWSVWIEALSKTDTAGA